MPTINLTNNTTIDITASAADEIATLNRYLKSILTFKTPPKFDPVADRPVSGLHELDFPIGLSATGAGTFAVEGATLNVQLGASASIGLLQGDDQSTFFSPLGITQDPTSSGLVSFALAGTLGAGPGAAFGGFAFGVTNNATLTLTSYYVAAANDTLRFAVQKAASTLTVPHDLADLKSLPVGAICQIDGAGSIKFSASFTYNFVNDPLAAVSIDKLPSFNINATAGATIEATATHTADHTITIARLPNKRIRLCVSLTNTNDFETSLTVSAGVGANIGGQDALAFLLDKINPNSANEADAIASQMANAADFKSDIKSAIDTALSASLAVSLKASLEKSKANNRVFLFEIFLNELDAESLPALQAALAGNFTPLTKTGAKLSGITPKDSALSITSTTTHTFAMHFLGIFNSSSINEFISKSTIDFTSDTHELVLTGESLHTSVNNLDSVKLHQLVLKAVSLTLPASANTPDVATPITLCYIDREASTSRSKMRQFVNVLAYLNAPAAPAAESLLGQNLHNYQVCSLSLALSLTPAQCRSLFVGSGGVNVWWSFIQRYCQAEKIILAGDPVSAFRLLLFNADQGTWNDLHQAGTASNTISILRSLGMTQPQAAIAVADVDTGVWWADAMSAYAKALANGQSLAAAGKSVIRDANLGFNEPWLIVAAWNLAGQQSNINPEFVTSLPIQEVAATSAG